MSRARSRQGAFPTERPVFARPTAPRIGSCLEGFECREVEAGFSACVKEDGLCPCVSPVAGMESRCSRSNQSGTCFGSRFCTRTGNEFAWGACSVGEPSQEVCNRIDDDCNGATDDMGTEVCGTGVCAHMVEKCVDGQAFLCDPYEGSQDEVCNGLDDNCNGTTDENWPDKGAACDGGDTDVCANGTWGCAEDGMGLTCEGDIASDVELCNGVDDDCDGKTDEPEDLGTIECGLGACHRVPACTSGVPTECDPMLGAVSPDIPDIDMEDVNCDGVDGDAASAVFVDIVSGVSGNDGSRQAPVPSIQEGIDIAASRGLSQVLVSQGVYNESIVLHDGVGVFGRYDSSRNWERAPSKVSQIRGGTLAVTADGIATDHPRVLLLPASLHRHQGRVQLPWRQGTAAGFQSRHVPSRQAPVPQGPPVRPEMRARREATVHQAAPVANTCVYSR